MTLLAFWIGVVALIALDYNHAGLDSPTAPQDISFLGLGNRCLCRGLGRVARSGSIRWDSNRIRMTPPSPHAGDVTTGVILDHLRVRH